jgi:hypothetical protein
MTEPLLCEFIKLTDQKYELVVRLIEENKYLERMVQYYQNELKVAQNQKL